MDICGSDELIFTTVAGLVKNRPSGQEQKAVFRFTNTGTAPLLIYNVVPSCDCTAVKWKKRPIKPGESGEIQTVYSPNSLGMFIKNIEVRCNVAGHKINLKIRGNVIE